MKKNILIAVLVLVIGIITARLIHIENQRTAMVSGMCRFNAADMNWQNCLKTAETRTSWIWHLYYGLTD